MRCFPILAAVLALALPGAALADDARPIAGTWTGSYSCGAVARGLTLTLTGEEDGAVSGEFAFAATQVKGADGVVSVTPGGRFRVAGRLNNGLLRLNGTEWLERPDGYAMVGLFGLFEPGPAGSTMGMSGQVLAQGCQGYRLTRPPVKG